MAEFRQGDRESFSELFGRYREPVYGFFRRRLDDATRAEDLAQETFLAVIRAAARWEPRALFRTWLYGIAMNLLAAERRRRRPVESNPEALEAAGTSNPDAGIWVRRAMAQLEPGERDVLLLREYEQLSYAEIAELLRLPLNTVRSRLFRARMALKGLLDPARRESARNII